MRRLVLAALLVVLPAASLSAQTLTIRDILDLTKAGLGEEVLLALIEVHRPVFPIDPDTLKMLKASGVRQRVIVALVKSGRELPVQPVIETEPQMATGAPAPAPQVVVIDHEQTRAERRSREIVPVAVPVYVPVRVRPIERERPPVGPVEPVYWGFGGKLRPDAWQPPDPHRRPSTTLPPFEPQKK